VVADLAAHLGGQVFERGIFEFRIIQSPVGWGGIIAGALDRITAVAGQGLLEAFGGSDAVGFTGHQLGGFIGVRWFGKFAVFFEVTFQNGLDG